MDPTDVAAVKALKETKPKTVGALHKLLGFMSYYWKYIKDFSTLVKPLYDLLTSATDTSNQVTKTGRQKKGTPVKSPPLGGQLSSNHQINWTEQHQERLNLLVDLLTQPGVMAYPDIDRPFVLHVDA